MKAKTLKKLENACFEASIKLSFALERLGEAASNILGYEVKADLCGGDEIEFRMPDDAFSVIRIEDVLAKIEEGTK